MGAALSTRGGNGMGLWALVPFPADRCDGVTLPFLVGPAHGQRVHPRHGTRAFKKMLFGRSCETDFCDSRGAVLGKPTFVSVKDSPQGPPTANRQPPTADRQPPTANRQPPTNVQLRFCGLVSCPCLGHEAEGVPVNVRFCWRYEPFFFS